MWNFNKIGRVIAETSVQRGLVVRMTKVWPWKRAELSGGMRYLVTVTNPQGVEVFNNYHSHKVLFSYIVMKYSEEVRPIRSYQDNLNIRAFSLSICIEDYLGKDLPDGTYMAMVPRDKKVSEAFWKVNADEVCTNHEDPRLDCYLADVSSYDGVLADLIADSHSMYPGRYFLIVVKDNFVQSTDSLT